MRVLTETEKSRISTAIATAESGTCGEIVAVLAPESGSYLYASFLWAAVVALFVPWPLIYFTLWSETAIFLTQLAVFVVVLSGLFPRGARLALVPRAVKHARAHRRAMEQFLSQNLHTTPGRTGVLIFLSAAERHAEILADTAIHARVAPGTWQNLVDTLTQHISEDRMADGLVAVIEETGALLAAHFPPGSAPKNELPNHLIVLEGE